MKSVTVSRCDYAQLPNLPYPNAATRRELIHKILDTLLMGAIGISCAAILLFIMALA